MLDHITPMVGQVEGQQQDYGQDQDENATAIQTITITSDHLGEFTQQLQTVSSQLQATSDIGEVYIQGKHYSYSFVIYIVHARLVRLMNSNPHSKFAVTVCTICSQWLFST